MEMALTKEQKKECSRELLKFTFPAILEQLLIRIASIIGVAFLGQIGAIELSASSLSSTLMTMIEALLMGISLGITVLSARFIEDRNKVHRVATAGFTVELLLSAILMIVATVFSKGIIETLFSNAEEIIQLYTAEYFSICILACPFMALDFTCSALMRASGDSRTPFFITLMSNGVNLVSIFLCLNVFHLRYTSVAMCYVLSFVVSCAVKICVIVSGKYKKYTYKFARFHGNELSQLFRIGIPASFERFLIQFAFLGMQMVTTMLGTTVLAGYQAGNNVVNFTYTITGGFEIALVSLVGRYRHSDMNIARQMIKASYKFSMIFTVAVGTVMFIVSPYAVRLFASEKEVIEQATVILRLLVLTIPLTTGFQAGIGALKTGKEINYSLAINIISPNFIRIPIAYFLVSCTNLGFLGLYIGCVTDYIVRASVVIWRVCVSFFGKEKQEESNFQNM